MNTVSIFKVIAAASILAVAAPAMADNTPEQSHIFGCDIDPSTGQATRTVDTSKTGSSSNGAKNYSTGDMRPMPLPVKAVPSQTSLKDTKIMALPLIAAPRPAMTTINCPAGTTVSADGTCLQTTE